MDCLEGSELEVWILLCKRAQLTSLDYSTTALQRRYVDWTIDYLDHFFNLFLELIVLLQQTIVHILLL